MLGLIALGERNRPDFEAAMKRILPGVSFSIAGALDGVSREKLADLADSNGEYPLRVPARDSEWEIPRDRLLTYLCQADAQLRRKGAKCTIIMCAGNFPLLPVRGPIIYPGSVAPAMLKGILTWRDCPKIGLVLPNASQMSFAKVHWENKGFSVQTAWASPKDIDALSRIENAFSINIDTIVLDCMGFGERHVKIVKSITFLPVVSTLHLTLHAAASFL